MIAPTQSSEPSAVIHQVRQSWVASPSRHHSMNPGVDQPIGPRQDRDPVLGGLVIAGLSDPRCVAFAERPQADARPFQDRLARRRQ